MRVASGFVTPRHVKIYLQFCVIKVDSFNFLDNIEPKMKVLFIKDAVSDITKLSSLT